MDRPRHPVVVRAWKVERLKKRTKEVQPRVRQQTGRRNPPHGRKGR